MKPWRTLKSWITYSDPWLTVRSHRLERANGAIVDPFHIIESPEWVCVCALTDAGDVVTIREYRHGAETITLGLPGGVCEPDDEDFAAAARRELEEETGFIVREMIPVGRAHANWANQNNQISYFLGLGAAPHGVRNLDPNEEIEPVLMPFAEFSAYDFDGPKQTHHAAALFYVLRFLQRHPGLGLQVHKLEDTTP